MTSEPLSICLDVTRLVSRTGRGPFTGIDRVEHAYLRGFLARDLSLSGFARTATGFVLLDRNGLSALFERIEGRKAWGKRDLLSKLSRRLSPARQRAEADLRRLSMARCPRLGLGRMLKRHLKPGTWLVNVGHSNLSERVLRAFSAAGQVAVMIHDLIPLDLPECHRPGMPESFRLRMEAVAKHADLILSPSEDTAGRVRATFPGASTAHAVHLGFECLRPDPAALAAFLAPRSPYFLCVGTIDPRKNQAFLIDLWDQLGTDPPTLYLVGSRGWCPPELSARLDSLPRGVEEISGLSDEALAALMEGSAGLLHPSRAEGYGIPPLEALQLGVPVLAGDLAVYRETLGDAGVYLTTDESYSWVQTIKTLADQYRGGERTRGRQQDGPTWDAHINHVLNLL